MTSLSSQSTSATHPAAVQTILSTLIDAHQFDASQIKQMGDKELETAVKNSLVFARITPESKYKILKILENTEITAMTGDGVNCPGAEAG